MSEVIRSSGHLRPPTTVGPQPVLSLYGPDSLSTLRNFRGRTATASRRALTEEVSWCGSCSAVENVGACCATPQPVGCALPAPLDGPRANAAPSYSLRAAQNGTGATVKPDVTPATVARGDWATRVTAKRSDLGKVTVRRLSVHGRHRLALNAHRGATAHTGDAYGVPTAPAPFPIGDAARDAYAVGRLNADGSTPVARTAANMTRRRRSRAAVVAATPATADAALTADAAAMVAADRIG